MPFPPPRSGPASVDDVVAGIARLARETGASVAVAETMTSGAIAVRLGGAADAPSWFVGGIVAPEESPFGRLLDTAGVSQKGERHAASVAAGVRRVTGADVAVAVTGPSVCGPGELSSSVVVAVDTLRGSTAHTVLLRGDRAHVVDGAVSSALTSLEGALRGQ